MDWLKELAVNVPAAAALLIATKWFLSHLAVESRDNRELWANHMGKQVSVLERLTVLIEQLIAVERSHRG